MTKIIRTQYQYAVGSASVIGFDVAPGHAMARGITMMPNPFLCCGLSALSGLGNVSLITFEEKAQYLSAIYGLSGGRTHYVFVVNPQQKSCAEFKTLVAAGAKLIWEFPNLQGGSHSGYNLEMYQWNPHAAEGIFLDHYGRPLPKDPSIKEAPVAKAAAPKLAEGFY